MECSDGSEMKENVAAVVRGLAVWLSGGKGMGLCVGAVFAA
jgi:hypothetical protein